jgi:hypothetical protein
MKYPHLATLGIAILITGLVLVIRRHEARLDERGNVHRLARHSFDEKLEGTCFRSTGARSCSLKVQNRRGR